jgi:hypothetical protein
MITITVPNAAAVDSYKRTWSVDEVTEHMYNEDVYGTEHTKIAIVAAAP